MKHFTRGMRGQPIILYDNVLVASRSVFCVYIVRLIFKISNTHPLFSCKIKRPLQFQLFAKLLKEGQNWYSAYLFENLRWCFQKYNLMKGTQHITVCTMLKRKEIDELNNMKMTAPSWRTFARSRTQGVNIVIPSNNNKNLTIIIWISKAFKEWGKGSIGE